jgi:hypothetical protein
MCETELWSLPNHSVAQNLVYIFLPHQQLDVAMILLMGI